MKLKKIPKTNKHGYSLVMVMIVIVILLAMGAGLMSLSLQGRLMAVRTISEISARTAADAGLAKAMREMNERLDHLPWNNTSLPQATDWDLTNSDASVSYITTGDLDSGFVIQSTGTAGRLERTVTASLRFQGLWDYGILTVEGAKLMSDSLVDGYNSGDASDTDVYVQVATINPDPESISFSPGASVDGDVLFGVYYEFPVITPPAYPGPDSIIDTKGSTLTLTPADSGRYSSISVSQQGGLPGVLQIDEGNVSLYITGDIWISQNSEIQITPGASLTLYVDGDISAGNSSGVNNENELPSAFTLYGTGEDQTFDLKAKSDTFGVIYAPEADLTIRSVDNVYGSFTASTFDLKSGGTIWYDGALRTVDVNDLGVRFVVEHWREE